MRHGSATSALEEQSAIRARKNTSHWKDDGPAVLLDFVSSAQAIAIVLLVCSTMLTVNGWQTSTRNGYRIVRVRLLLSQTICPRLLII